MIIENKTVTFVPITFEDLTSDRYKSFDAIFIMKERLLEASNDKYSKTFTQLQKPIIFIGTNTLIPFRLDGILYHPKEFQEGLPYSKGFIDGTEYGFGLYNDKENKASIQLFYSELFRLFE